METELKTRLVEYRVTRNAPYNNPRCFGFSDLTARQGYYIVAASAEEALLEMHKQFPRDNFNFTCQFWKEV